MLVASWPLTHQTEPSLEPMARRTSFISSGTLTTVTTQKRAPLAEEMPRSLAKWTRLTLKFLLSSWRHFRVWPLALTVSPSLGMTVIWLGKYSFRALGWRAFWLEPVTP